jgi:hypothetical protein
MDPFTTWNPIKKRPYMELNTFPAKSHIDFNEVRPRTILGTGLDVDFVEHGKEPRDPLSATGARSLPGEIHYDKGSLWYEPPVHVLSEAETQAMKLKGKYEGPLTLYPPTKQYIIETQANRNVAFQYLDEANQIRLGSASLSTAALSEDAPPDNGLDPYNPLSTRPTQSNPQLGGGPGPLVRAPAAAAPAAVPAENQAERSIVNNILIAINELKREVRMNDKAIPKAEVKLDDSDLVRIRTEIQTALQGDVSQLFKALKTNMMVMGDDERSSLLTELKAYVLAHGTEQQKIAVTGDISTLKKEIIQMKQDIVGEVVVVQKAYAEMIKRISDLRTIEEKTAAKVNAVINLGGLINESINTASQKYEAISLGYAQSVYQDYKNSRAREIQALQLAINSYLGYAQNLGLSAQIQQQVDLLFKLDGVDYPTLFGDTEFTLAEFTPRADDLLHRYREIERQLQKLLDKSFPIFITQYQKLEKELEKAGIPKSENERVEAMLNQKYATLLASYEMYSKDMTEKQRILEEENLKLRYKLAEAAAASGTTTVEDAIDDSNIAFDSAVKSERWVRLNDDVRSGAWKKWDSWTTDSLQEDWNNLNLRHIIQELYPALAELCSEYLGMHDAPNDKRQEDLSSTTIPTVEDISIAKSAEQRIDVEMGLSRGVKRQREEDISSETKRRAQLTLREIIQDVYSRGKFSIFGLNPNAKDAKPQIEPLDLLKAIHTLARSAFTGQYASEYSNVFKLWIDVIDMSGGDDGVNARKLRQILISLTDDLNEEMSKSKPALEAIIQQDGVGFEIPDYARPNVHKAFNSENDEHEIERKEDLEEPARAADVALEIPPELQQAKLNDVKSSYTTKEWKFGFKGLPAPVTWKDLVVELNQLRDLSENDAEYSQKFGQVKLKLAQQIGISVDNKELPKRIERMIKNKDAKFEVVYDQRSHRAYLKVDNMPLNSRSPPESISQSYDSEGGRTRSGKSFK